MNEGGPASTPVGDPEATELWELEAYGQIRGPYLLAQIGSWHREGLLPHVTRMRRSASQDPWQPVAEALVSHAAGNQAPLNSSASSIDDANEMLTVLISIQDRQRFNLLRPNPEEIGTPARQQVRHRKQLWLFVFLAAMASLLVLGVRRILLPPDNPSGSTVSSGAVPDPDPKKSQGFEKKAERLARLKPQTPGETPRDSSAPLAPVQAPTDPESSAQIQALKAELQAAQARIRKFESEYGAMKKDFERYFRAFARARGYIPAELDPAYDGRSVEELEELEAERQKSLERRQAMEQKLKAEQPKSEEAPADSGTQRN